MECENKCWNRPMITITRLGGQTADTELTRADCTFGLAKQAPV